MNNKKILNYLRIFSLSFCLIVVFSCGDLPGSTSDGSIKEPSSVEESVTGPQDQNKGIGDTDNNMPLPESNEEQSVENYTVKLEADESLKDHEIGVLKIWIGDSKVEHSFIREEKVQDSATFPADVGSYAKITPFSNGFVFEPESVECFKIHPSGSEHQFKIKPTGSTGEFEVSANIELFVKPDCSGPKVPKNAETLKVVVEVDYQHSFMDKLGELWDVFWEKFLSFWGALIALIFGTILYLIRSKIKKKTGYSEDKK